MKETKARPLVPSNIGFENHSVFRISNELVDETQGWNGPICDICGLKCLSDRNLRAHRRSCMFGNEQQDSIIQGQDNIGTTEESSSRYGIKASKSDISVNHALDSNHIMHEDFISDEKDSETYLRHDRDVRKKEDVEQIPIKTSIRLPKSTNSWNLIEETISTQLSVRKPYRKDDTLGEKFRKVNDFIYGVFQVLVGEIDQDRKPSKKKEKKRKDEEVEIRSIKKELKREFKDCTTEEEKGENRRKFHKLIRLHNKLRKAKEQSQNDKELHNQHKQFKKNPYQMGKELLKPKEGEGDPTFDEETAKKYFEDCYRDVGRGTRFEPIEEMIKPETPEHGFNCKTPSTEEVIQYIKKRRNKSSGGTTKIQYVMLKKCKSIMHLYVELLIEAWDHLIKKGCHEDIPVHWIVAIRKLIPKTDDLSDPSRFRDINLSNIDGKIFFGLISKRANKFMVENHYIDTKIQKGFINGVPGVLEHTYSMTEIVNNSREHQRSICITWIDLKNAFGSVSHDLIDFVLEWYHWPIAVRKIIHSYYTELYVRVHTRPWNLDWIRIERGIFQGDTIADILFNTPWNVCLQMIESCIIEGYDHKEAGVKTKQKVYVDDLTLLSKTAAENQLMLDVVSRFLEWSGMAAKPIKCRSYAQRIFTAYGKNLGFHAIDDTNFSSYDPRLNISGTPIPFLGDEPYRMLGKNISGKSRKGAEKCMVEEKLVSFLDAVNKSHLTGVQKTWIYEHLIIPSIRWELTIYEFNITFIDGLNSIITRYLKKWLRITKTADTSILYRSKDHFGLNLPNITTVYKSAQIGKEFKMKCSKDLDIQAFYTEKFQVQALKKNWYSTKHLEKTQRAVYLDEMSFSGQTSRQGVGFVEKEKITEGKKVVLKSEELDEMERLSHAAQLAMQGQWTKWDNVMAQDWSWQALLYSYTPTLLSFALNSIQLTLPTPDNLQRWNKRSDAKCTLCGRNNCTLMHILTGCPVSLREGRFTWRHDSILSVITEALGKVIEEKNKATPVKEGTKDMIDFVRTGEKPKKSTPKKTGLLDFANDWLLHADLGENQLVFPTHIYITNQRPDIVIVADSTHTVILIELTSPAEENIYQRNSDKRQKYASLVEECGTRGWKVLLFCVEIGARGFVADSFFGSMKKLGMTNAEVKGIKKKVSMIALRCSYAIYVQRERKDFVKWRLNM